MKHFVVVMWSRIEINILCRVVIGQQRSMRYMESFRILRDGLFIGYMASGMKDCIMVIRRQPSVFGGQVNEHRITTA